MEQNRETTKDVKIDVNVKNIDEIVIIAENIWNKVQEFYRSKPRDICEKDIDSLYDELFKEYKDFAYSYSMVFNMMVKSFIYDKNAFRTYLLNDVKPFYKTYKEFNESNASYLTKIYKTYNPNVSTKELSEYNDMILVKLNKEHLEYMECLKKSKEEFKQQKITNLENQKKILINYLESKRSDALLSNKI